MIQNLRHIESWQKTLIIVFIAQLTSVTGFSFIFPFLPLYVQSLDTSLGLSVEILSGLVFSAQAATMMLASPIWGTIADRYGRKLMVERAMFGGALILLLMGYVGTAEQLILLRAVQGVVTGVASAANALVASVAPRNRTGFAMGTLQVAQLSGVAIGPLIGGALADAFGYRQAFVLTAACLLFGGFLVYFGVREEFTPTAETKATRPSFIAAWRHVLRAEGVLAAYILRFLSGLTRVMIIPIAPLFVLGLLGSEANVNTITGLVVGVAAAASTLTAIYLGRLGDRIGYRRILIVCTLIAGFAYLPQSLVSNVWQLLGLQLLTGAASGGIIPAISALLARLTEPGEEGSVFGLDNSIAAGSRAIAPLLGSTIAFWFGLRAVFFAVGLILFLLTFLSLRLLPHQNLKPT